MKRREPKTIATTNRYQRGSQKRPEPRTIKNTLGQGKPKRRGLKLLDNILTTVLILIAVAILIFTVVSVNTVNKETSIFGYRPYIVLSDSMSGTFDVGDMILTKVTDTPEAYQPGDIITFKSIDPNNYGEVVTHCIRSVTTYEGQQAYVTYGLATGVDDAYPVPVDQVIGEYQKTLPKLGYFFDFMKSPMGYFIIILIPFGLLIVYEAVKFIKLMRQYKREQQAILLRKEQEAQAERQRAMAERRKAAAMQKELLELKRQLAEQEKERREP